MRIGITIFNFILSAGIILALFLVFSLHVSMSEKGHVSLFPVALAAEPSPSQSPSLFEKIFNQMQGVFSFTAQAIQAVLEVDPKTFVNDIGPAIQDPVVTLGGDFGISGNVFVPQKPDLTTGSLIMNVPFMSTNNFMIEGSTRLEETTVNQLLTVVGRADLSSLRVKNNTQLQTLDVAGKSLLSSVEISNTATVGGSLSAFGGIVTDGADIDLGEGNVFASNVVNELVAGKNITITGTPNAPIISAKVSGGGGSNDTLASARARAGCAECVTDSDIVSTLTISGGLINNTSIGLTTAAAAAFTNVSIGTSLATSTLTVNGTIDLNGQLAVTGGATSTFDGNINVTNGCVAVNGICLGGGVSSLNDLSDVTLGTTTDGDLLVFNGTRWVNSSTTGLGLSTATFLGLTDTPSTFATSAIPYVNTGSTALVQSTDFVFDGTNLGIGTSTPSARLTVDGSTKLDGTLSLLGNALFSQQLEVTGTSTLTGLLSVTNAATFSSSLNVTGSTTLSGGLSTAGDAAFANNLSVSGNTTLGNNLSVDGVASVLNGSAVRWYDADSSNYVALKASTTLTGNITWTLPTADGGSDEVLVTDGSGRLRFEPVSALGGSITKYIDLDDTPSSFAAGTIPFVNASGTALLHSSLLKYDGSYFGIGSTVATAELSVDGSVNFVAGDGSIDFVFDDTSKFIGIGTDSPTSKLTLMQGSLVQIGGSASDLYSPSLLKTTTVDDRATAVEVYGKYAYVTSKSVGDDFQIFDITSPTNPSEVGAVNLPDNANGMAIDGHYAYVVTAFSGNDFHVIDISDPANPVEVDSLNFSASANAVVVDGKYAYVGTDAGSENVQIIDVSDPTAVTVIGSSTLPSSVRDITVKDGYAYAVTEISGDDFHVIDISDPANPSIVDSLNLSDTADAVEIAGVYAYVGTYSSGNDIHVIDISDPSNISESTSIDLGTGVSVTDIHISGSLMYVVSLSAGQDIQVIDISSPASPVNIGGVDLGSGDVLGVSMVGKNAYVVSAAGMGIVDVSGASLQSVYTNSLQTGDLMVTGDTNFMKRVAVAGEMFAASGIRSGGLLRVYGDGNSYITNTLSVGTTSSSSAALTVDGVIQSTDLLGGPVNLTTDANGNIIREPSDVRLKENVVTIEDALASVLQLRGVRYEWKDKERFGSEAEIGFIAQEVDMVLPEIVRKGGDYWSINTRNILAVVVEGMKEMWAILQGTQADIDTLRLQVEELEYLRERVDTLELQFTDTTDTTDTTDDGQIMDLSVGTDGSDETATSSDLVQDDQNTEMSEIVDENEIPLETSDDGATQEDKTDGEEEIVGNEGVLN